MEVTEEDPQKDVERAKAKAVDVGVLEKAQNDLNREPADMLIIVLESSCMTNMFHLKEIIFNMSARNVIIEQQPVSQCHRTNMEI